MEDYALAAVAPPTDEEVAEALEKAADLFITEGWAQGGYHVSKTAAMAQKQGVVPTTTFVDDELEEGEEC
jgi:1-aminocyclopropane-1-carboxylate deaminase/D-cysteine desulfhydrase-like pyridoxal-dependent ACC family enzyme